MWNVPIWVTPSVSPCVLTPYAESTMARNCTVTIDDSPSSGCPYDPIAQLGRHLFG